ncbi:histidine N-acetyltransferase [Branchiostoma belcheri]|nr:histidine N-acetyltransferase [Branchiostoma belcheri]
MKRETRVRFRVVPAKGPARSQSEVAIRLARHGDYSAVMRISEGLYYSTDYVPAKFHSLIDHPDHTVFVAEVGEQVVGMAASKYTEDGRVFIGKAARVAPDWRGQGISTDLCVQGEAWIRQHRLTVKHGSTTCGSVFGSGPRGPVFESYPCPWERHLTPPHSGYRCSPGLWWRQDPAQLAQLEPTGLPDVVPLQDADDDFCTAVQKWLPAGACGGYEGVIELEKSIHDFCRDVLNMDELHKPGLHLQAVLFESEL